MVVLAYHMKGPGFNPSFAKKERGRNQEKRNNDCRHIGVREHRTPLTWLSLTRARLVTVGNFLMAVVRAAYRLEKQAEEARVSRLSSYFAYGLRSHQANLRTPSSLSWKNTRREYLAAKVPEMEWKWCLALALRIESHNLAPVLFCHRLFL